MTFPSLLAAFHLFAEDAPKGGGGGGLFGPENPMFLFLAMGLLLYFIVLRPMRRQEKERVAMQEGIRKHDEVVTNSGIVGTIVSLKKDKEEILLESGTSRLRIVKSSIARVLKRGDEPATADDESESEEKK